MFDGLSGLSSQNNLDVRQRKRRISKSPQEYGYQEAEATEYSVGKPLSNPHSIGRLTKLMLVQLLLGI